MGRSGRKYAPEILFASGCWASDRRAAKPGRCEALAGPVTGELRCWAGASSGAWVRASCEAWAGQGRQPCPAQAYWLQASCLQEGGGVGLLHSREVGEHLHGVFGVATADDLVAEGLAHGRVLPFIHIFCSLKSLEFCIFVR